MIRSYRRAIRLLAAACLIGHAVYASTGLPVDATEAGDQSRPTKFVLQDFPRVEQLPNYCGPASLSAVLKFWGSRDQDQQTIAKSIYDVKLQATNGAEMLLYARKLGFSAYSFNGTLSDLKRLVCQGLPVIVLTETSSSDKSGHFRVVIGYDENAAALHILDPYDTARTLMTYGEFSNLWRAKGNWGLLVVPKEKDRFAGEMGDRNTVVHLDLAQVYCRQGSYDEADREIHIALKLEPDNPGARELLSEIESRRGSHSE